MAAGGFRQLPVVDHGNLIGIVTDRDLRHHTGYLESTLDAAMTSCPVVISPFRFGGSCGQAYDPAQNRRYRSSNTAARWGSSARAIY
jgi:hypothetical protein